MCREERLLYRLISGVHANVNIHISKFYFDARTGHSYNNYEMYYDRVGTHKERLANMFFTYSFVLRALNRAYEYLWNMDMATGNAVEETRTRLLLHKLLNSSLAFCEEPFKERNLLTQMSEREFVK